MARSGHLPKVKEKGVSLHQGFWGASVGRTMCSSHRANSRRRAKRQSGGNVRQGLRGLKHLSWFHPRRQRPLRAWLYMGHSYCHFWRKEINIHPMSEWLMFPEDLLYKITPKHPIKKPQRGGNWQSQTFLRVESDASVHKAYASCTYTGILNKYVQ